MQSVTFWKEHRLKIFENKVLRRIFVSKGEEVTGIWRQLHNEELSNLQSSTNIVRLIKLRMMRWVGHVAHMEGMRNAYKFLVRKPDRKSPFRRPKHGWEDTF
jgi:hypothetical protein